MFEVISEIQFFWLPKLKNMSFNFTYDSVLHIQSKNSRNLKHTQSNSIQVQNFSYENQQIQRS